MIFMPVPAAVTVATKKAAADLACGDFDETYIKFLAESLKISSFCKINAELALTNAVEEFINNL